MGGGTRQRAKRVSWVACPGDALGRDGACTGQGPKGTSRYPDCVLISQAGSGGSGATTVEPEQAFLARHLETLLKDPNRDPRQSFRSAIASASAATAASSAPGGDGVPGAESKFATYGGVVGPMGQGGLSLPGVEKVMAEMEGGAAEDIKEKFARLSRRVSVISEGYDARADAG